MKIKELLYNGKRLRYLDEGQGIPIVFIHGWGISPLTYEDTITSLSKHFRVIAPYLRESGDMESQQKTIRKLIELLSIEKPILFGHSAAVITAITFAFHNRQYVRALVLVDTMGMKHPYSYSRWFLIWFRHVLHLFYKHETQSTPFLLRLSKDFLWQVFRHPNALRNEALFALKTDVSSYLTELSLPILLLWGKNDDLTPPSDAYQMAARNDHITFEMLEGGHDWLKVKPSLLIDKMESFVGRIQTN